MEEVSQPATGGNLDGPEGSDLPGANPNVEVVAFGQLWRIEGVLTAVRAELAQVVGDDGDDLRRRAAAIEGRCRRDLGAALPAPLVPELDRLLSWSDRGLRTDGELRVALAQLDGWLGGVLSGLGYALATSPGD